MKYNFNGKEINIPDNDIKKLMSSLDITKAEAIDTWLDDHDYIDNAEAEAMTEKAKQNRRYEKSDAPRKKAQGNARSMLKRAVCFPQLRQRLKPSAVLFTASKTKRNFRSLLTVIRIR